MRILKIVTGLILVLIPLIIGLVAFLLFFGILELEVSIMNRYIFVIGKEGSSMMPVFFGIMLLSGVMLLNDTTKNE